MKISRVRKTSATLVETDNLTLLVSYRTPVAAVVWDHSDLHGTYVINSFYSVTTSRHVREFLDQHALNGEPIQEKPESFFQDLLERKR